MFKPITDTDLASEEDALREECRTLGISEIVAETMIAAMRMQWAIYRDFERFLREATI
jgi:hypothetical protein